MNIRPGGGASVSLLVDEDASVALTHRQTAARPVVFAGLSKDVPSFADGSVHVEQPQGRCPDTIFNEWRGLPLEELYTNEYLAFVHRKKARAALTAPRPIPMTPDFDTDMLINSDTVTSYVQGMAAAFNEPRSAAPSLLNMLEELTCEACNAAKDNSADFDSTTNRSATPTRSSSLSAMDVQIDSYSDDNRMQERAQVDGEWLAGVGGPADIVISTIEPHPFLSGDALALSLALVDIASQRGHMVKLLLERVVQSPTPARTLSDEVVQCALDSLEFAVAEVLHVSSVDRRDPAVPPTSDVSNLVHQCELVGAVVCARHSLAETLRFAHVMEDLSRIDGGTSAMPSAPRLVEVMMQSAVNNCTDALRSSPFHGRQETPTAVDLPINSRTRAEHICVSPDRSQLAVVTATGVSTFSLSSDKPSPCRNSDFPVNTPGSSPPWCSVYSSDSQFLVLANEHGTVHTVYTASSLVQHCQIVTDSPRVPLDYKDGVLLTMPAPVLPSGSASSLLLYRGDSAAFLVSKLVDESVAGATLVASCVLGHDFEGTFMAIRTDATTLVLTVEKGVLNVTDGASRSYAALPLLRKWSKVVVQWTQYVPSVSVNGQFLKLKGEHIVRRRLVHVHAIDCFDCESRGHVGDVSALLRGCQPRTGSHNDGSSRRIDTAGASAVSHGGVTSGGVNREFSARNFPALSTTTLGSAPIASSAPSRVPEGAGVPKSGEACLLLHLPLDEGTGLWVKEMVARRCCPLPLQRVEWDISMPTPQRANGLCAELGHKTRSHSTTVRIENNKLLQSRVVVSAQHVYFMWPPKLMTGESLVVQVLRATGTIQEVHHCVGVGRDTCLALLPDESGFYALQHPLNTMTFVGLHVPSARRLELLRLTRRVTKSVEPAVDGTRSPPLGGLLNVHTTGAFLRVVYLILYSWAPVLECLPVCYANASVDSLNAVVRLIESVPDKCDDGDTVLRQAALVALATVHARALPQADVASVATTLTACALAFSDRWQDEQILKRGAEDLMAATTLKCVSVRDLVTALFRIDEPAQQRLLTSCVSRQNLPTLMHFIADQDDCAKLDGFVEKLIEQEQQALAAATKRRRGSPSDQQHNGSDAAPSQSLSCGVSGLFHIFAAMVTALHGTGRQSVIARLLLRRIEYATSMLEGDGASPQSSSEAASEVVGATPSEVDHAITTVGLIPLLLVVRQVCPLAIGEDSRIQDGLLRLLRVTSARLSSTPEANNHGADHESGDKARTEEAHPPERVRFAFRETVEVVPASERADGAWRVEMDYRGASSISLLKSASSGAITAVYVPLHVSESCRFDMPAGEGFTAIDGDELVLFGKGATSFSVIASFEVERPPQGLTLLREAIVSALVTYAESRLRSIAPSSLDPASTPNRSREFYVPAMLRGGLSSSALKAHGVELTGRGGRLAIAEEILNDCDDGKLLVDYTVGLMRSSILPSMRPAVRALLCLLVVSGANTHRAAEELKHLWFSGEWGSKLQGVTRDHTTRQLTDLAAWMTNSVHYNADAASESFRRTSMSDRRMEASLNESRSVSEARNSASVTSRRGTVHYADTLEQVHTLLANGISAMELEEVLVARTESALHSIEALQLLVQITSIPFADAALATVGPVIDALSRLSDFASPVHSMDSLSGAGYELEHQLRATYHLLLSQCQRTLLGWQQSHQAVYEDAESPFAKTDTVSSTVPLLEVAPIGRRILSLFALLCHPWDVDDCELFTQNLNTEGSILHQLQKPLSALTTRLVECSTATTAFSSPACNDLQTDTDHVQHPLAAIDLTSMCRPYPNGFSVVIPQIQTSSSAEGTVMKKSSPKATVICADREWPLTWQDGLPAVFYFEVRLQTAPTDTAIGLSLNARQKDMAVFYSDAGDTHEAALPPFHLGDVVGCGVLPVTGHVLLTLNGRLLFIGAAPKKARTVLPAVRLGQASQVIVNFGTSPFTFDGRCLHAAVDTERGPTNYLVSALAGVVLHHLTTRVCLAHEQRRESGSKGTLRHYCCMSVCDAVKKVTASLMDMHTATDRVNRTVALSAAEQVVVLLIATIRRLVNSNPHSLANFSQHESERLFETVSLLMLLPLHSIQVATLSLLAEVVQCVQTVKDSAAQHLVDVLFKYAMAAHSEAESTAVVPFVPRWTDCDARFMSITSSKTATMLPDAQRSAVIGAPLPRTGTVSFSVRITRSNMHKGHSLKGGYFIGVSVAGLTPLSPSSNSQSWKSVKPPVVWALHDISPQLAYATNPTVRPNNFQRTFGHADVVRVVVDRDRGTVDFYRENEYLTRLFSDVPNDVDIVPFAQLYNDDAEAHLIDGEMTAPLTAATLLSSVSVDVLRCMLTLEPFEALVARRLCEEMDRSTFPRVSLMVFNSLPDPRLLRLPSTLVESGTEIKVTRLVGLECKFNLDGEAHFEYLHNMRRSLRLKITCSIATDVNSSNASLHGLRMCVSKLVSAARQIAVPLITTQALCFLESEGRQRIMDDEREHWAFLFHGVRANTFKSVRDEIARIAATGRPVLRSPTFERTYVFSPYLSHPGFHFSRQSRYQLATVPSENKNMAAPYIAIAEPAVPSTGTFSIRCQLMRGSSGQILGGGYYFGVCTSALTWAGKELCNNTINVWAIHDMEDSPWRLRHILPTATFPVVVEPRCIIVSGDIIRLEIDRSAHTMTAFRKPVGGAEVPMGLIYDNLPPVPLYPFVHLFNTDAVAVLLPSASEEPAVRLSMPKAVYSVVDLRAVRFCDGCYALHHECKLTSTWYKCNVCADYSLCASCYQLFVHSKHTFTQMGDGNIVHSRRPPREFTKGMPVVVSTSPCVYLRSAACRLEEDNLWSSALAVDENALVMWGITRTSRTQFSVTIESTDDEPLNIDSPVFVGVGAVDDVLALARKNMRSWCHQLTTDKVCLSNDPTLHTPMQREGRSPYGFQSGDTISFEVNIAKSVVTVFRNWIVLGTCSLQQTRRSHATGMPPLVCFVSFGRPNTKATLFSEGPATTLARVEDVKAYILRAVTNTGECIVVSKENCRLPLVPLVELCPTSKPCAPTLPQEMARWSLGYTFVNQRMVQARLESLEGTDVRLNVLETGETIVVPTQCFLVNDSGTLALDSLVHLGRASTTWPTMKSCFVLSRYLLILSCLCESDMLSPLVTSLGSDIIGILKGLASVHITRDAATEFLTDIRQTVAQTTGWVSYRGSEMWRAAAVGDQKANGIWALNDDAAGEARSTGLPGSDALTFVPTLGTEERRRRYRQGMLVHVLSTEDAESTGHTDHSAFTRSDSVYRLMERRGDLLSLSDCVTGETRECSFRQCIPVKQCAGSPWYLVSNSVPCSLLEHSARVSEVPQGTNRVLTLEGTWEGSAFVAEGRSTAFRLTLTSHWSGEALFNLPAGGDNEAQSASRTSMSATTLSAVYQHNRLERTVTVYALPASVALHVLRDIPRDSEEGRFEEAQSAIRTFAETGAPDAGSQVILLRGTLDYDGTRMDGVYKRGDEQSVAFHLKLRQHVPLAAATTRERCVEPLPACVDAVLAPPRHRDAPEVMHRLIVLLAHHLYLVLSSHSYVSWNELDSALLLNDHPVTQQLVGNAIGVPQLLQLVTDAANLIFAPKVKAWEAATLARLLTESFLLRSDVQVIAPRALVWDALHAVVAAAHRCGEYCRHQLVTSVTTFLRRHQESLPPVVLRQLLALLVAQLNSSVTCPSAFVEASRDSSALMELVLASPPLIQSCLRNRSVDPLKCLVAVWQALSNGTPLPKAVESSTGNELVVDGPVQTDCVFGDYDNDVLKVGKVVSAVSAPVNARSYYEVVLPEHVPSQFSVGWGTTQHKEVPSQHVGSDAASFGFNGTDILTPKGRQEYRISSELTTGVVIGCMLDLTEHTVAWSMNGYQGPHVPLPLSLKGNALFAFVSIGACKGMTIRMRAEQFEYDPDGYTDLSGRHSRPIVREVDPLEVSALPVQPLAFYWQLASYLSDADEEKSVAGSPDREASVVSNNVSACTPMRSTSITASAPKYPLLHTLSVFELTDYSQVIQVLESCMTTASHYVDLDGDTITGQLSQSFVFLKRFVRRQFRRKLVSMHMQYPEKRQSPTAVTISLTELYSTLPRSPDVALQHTVLAQLHRQIGAFTDAQWMSTPLFLVHLFTTESGQAPTDAGGPYRQVWTCLADEIMAHPDRCFPHTEFHRNPLFVFVNNSQRLTLVPDTYASSPYELTLFQFFGKLMGYAARSKTPCAVDLSPFLWKFLVDDTLSIRDYYTHVNSVVEKSIEDDEFLSSGVAEDVIPGFLERVEWPKEEGLSTSDVVESRRKVAEDCLIHSMDKQLKAIQTGLWSTLPRRVARCLSWSELENLVCGTADPSVAELRQCIRLQLTGPRPKYFWQILSEMTSEQKSNLLCFASGQKRLPLIRSITISETNESVDHLPRAQSCFSIITLPKYSSYEMFKEKLLLALSHQTEMDLA